MSKDSSSSLLLPTRRDAPNSRGSSSGNRKPAGRHKLERNKTLTRSCNLHFDENALEWVAWDDEDHGGEPEESAMGKRNSIAEDVDRAIAKEANSTRDTLCFYSLIYLMAVFTCMLSFLNDVVIEYGFRLRGAILWTVTTRLESATPVVLGCLQMLAWVGFEMALLGIAHACARKIPMSYGSGIPEIHCELQGTHMRGFLAPGMLRAKALGLMFAQVSGLPIGKEGPFVHCAAAMTRFLAHTPLFSPALRIPGCLRQLMVVSVAVGTCSTVGVPIGGVLFALEVLPDTIWENMSYWMSIGTATIGGVTLYLLKLMFQSIIVSLVPSLPDEVAEARFFADPLLDNVFHLALSALLGLVCGVLGGLFVRSQISVQTWLRRVIAGTPRSSGGFNRGAPKSSTPRLVLSKHHTMMDGLDEPLQGSAFRVAALKAPSVGSNEGRLSSRSRAMLLCLLVALIDGLVSFTVPLARGVSQPKLLWKLVAADWIDWGSIGTEWVPPLPHDSLFEGLHGFVPLLLFLAVKWVMTVLALSLPVPSGCIIPSYILGALIGRVFSYMVQSGMELLSDELRQARYIHVQFSFIGATAFTCAICHSFSVVVVMFELVNGTQDVLLRLGVAAIVSIYMANHVSASIFQASAAMKRLPQTPQSRKLLDGWEPVSLAMRKEVAVVPEIFGPAPGGSEILEAQLNKYPHHSDFAVLAGGPELGATPCILGTLPRTTVERALFIAAQRFEREEVQIATQVDPSMPIKHAQLALELFGCSELYVVDKGELIGIINFNDIVHYGRTEGNVR